MEGLLLSLIHASQIALENPADYEARSNIMWIEPFCLGNTEKAEIALKKPTGLHRRLFHSLTNQIITDGPEVLPRTEGLNKPVQYQRQSCIRRPPPGPDDRQPVRKPPARWT